MDLTAFVDNQVDEHTDLIGLSVAQHPAGALAAPRWTCPAEELAPIMSTLYWQTIATDPTFRIALVRLGVRGPAETLRTIVVPHGAAGQYDLLVLDPTWGREATAQALPLGRFEADVGGPVHWADRVPELQERYGAAYFLPAETMATRRRCGYRDDQDLQCCLRLHRAGHRRRRFWRGVGRLGWQTGRLLLRTHRARREPGDVGVDLGTAGVRRDGSAVADMH